MKATEANFLGFLKRSPQFVIPIYQRTYSWTERECAQLWEDILRTGGNDDIPAHFTGSIVYIEKGLYQVSSQSSLLVIDGQQRVTTLMLILEALARHVGDGEPVDGFSAKKLRSYYLLNPLEEGERGFKLLLTQTDKQSLLALIQQKSEPAESSLRIARNFAFFEQKVRALGTTGLAPLCQGLAKLMIVDIALNRDQDNPQLIFESMNSTGRELSQADLIRNFILMGLEPAHQTCLYEEHWRPMEIAFGQEAYGTHFDGFMRHYLTFKTGEIPNVRAVYEAFKGHARSPEVAAAGVDALVADVHTYAGYYCAMALDREDDKELATAFRDLRELKVDVAFPLLLELYDDYAQGRLPKDEFVQAVRLPPRPALIEASRLERQLCLMQHLDRSPLALVDRAQRRFHRQWPQSPQHRLAHSFVHAIPTERDAPFGSVIQMRPLTVVAQGIAVLARVGDMQAPATVPATQKARQQPFPLADGTADSRSVAGRVVGDQLLVPLVVGPADIALVMITDQNFPVFPPAPDAAHDPLAAVLQPTDAIPSSSPRSPRPRSSSSTTGGSRSSTPRTAATCSKSSRTVMASVQPSRPASSP